MISIWRSLKQSLCDHFDIGKRGRVKINSCSANEFVILSLIRFGLDLCGWNNDVLPWLHSVLRIV